MAFPWIDRFTLPGSGTPQTVFALTYGPDAATLEAYRNGVLLYPATDYMLSGSNVTLLVTAHNDLIQFSYYVATVTPSGSGLATAQDFIYQALRKLGHLRPGYLPSPELLNDALNEWGLFFDALGTDRLNQFTNPDYVYSVTGPGSQSGGNGYQIGPTAADWVGPRPTSIIRANLVQNNAPQKVYIPMQPISQEQWAALAVRQIPATNIASVFWYDPQFPNGVFNVFPPINGNSIELFQFGTLAPPANLAALYSAPPGYEDMLVFNLAARLYYMVPKMIMPEKVPYQLIAGQAKAALDKLRMLNRPVNQLGNDFRGGGRPDGFFDSFITYTGEPY